MKGLWWKFLGAILVMYAIVGGMLLDAPDNVGQLDETIRNLFYHVPMWFAMMTLLFVSVIYNVHFLRKQNRIDFLKSDSLIKVCLLLGVLGLATGSLWAKATWGAWWTKDPKLNGAAVGMLVYCAYLVLSNSIDDKHNRARILSVYNLFVYPIFIALIAVMPKMVDFSMHPGSGDTVAFNTYDLDNNLRMVFYPAVIGWILLAGWMANLYSRYQNLKEINNEKGNIA